VQPGPELGSQPPYRNAQFLDALHQKLIEQPDSRALM
jgi:hypothetical protein